MTYTRRCDRRDVVETARTGRKWRAVCAALSVILFGDVTFAEPAPADRTPLTSIGLTTDLDVGTDPDDPAWGGGFDAANYFENLLELGISSCTRQVAGVVEAWMASKHLEATLREGTPARLLIHAVRPGETGFFEVSYRFDHSKKRARVTVFFVGGDGRLHEPSGIPSLLTDFGVADLQDRLRNAIRCGTT